MLINHCYIISCKTLHHRLNEVIKIPNLLNIDYSVSKCADKESFTKDIYQLCRSDYWSKRVKKILPILVANINAGEIGGNYEDEIKSFKKFRFYRSLTKKRSLRDIDISLLLKHYHILASIANGRDKYALILEDDVRLKKDTLNRFPRIIKSFINQNGDYLDLAGGCNLGPSLLEMKNNIDEIVKLSIPRTRTTAAIVLSRELAEQLCNNFLPLVFPIDWHLQYLIHDMDINCFWIKEPIFIHGSQEGLVKSSLDI